MSTTTLKDITAAARASALTVTGIVDSGRVFDPKAAPQPLSHRSFAVSVSSRDTGKYRSDSRRRMRKAARVILRISHRMLTRDETADLPLILADVENIEAALWNSSTAPLNGVARVVGVTISEPKPTAVREHTLTDVVLDVEYDRDSSTVTV